MEKIKGYKAFNPDWKCRDFQYELGETYKHDGNVNPCSSGFHFCENPLDVLEYYNNAFNQKYAEVEGSGTVINEGDKTCCSEIKIIKELTFLDLFTAHHNKVFENIDKETETTNTSGNYAHANTSGDEAHANTSGDKSHANTSGYKAHANTSGDEAISCCLGIQGKSRAEKGWIIIVDWRQDNNYNWSIKDVYKGKVGDKIKNMKIRPDYWYWFEDGKLKREKAAD